MFVIPCERLRTLCPCTLPLQPAPPGTLTAHMKSTLVLLYSYPDTVRWHILRETQTSTPLIKGCHISADPLAVHHPHYSGLKVQGTATAPAARCFYYNLFAILSSMQFIVFLYYYVNEFFQGISIPPKSAKFRSTISIST